MASVGRPPLISRSGAGAYWAGETTPSGKSERARRPQAGQAWIAARCSVTISGFSGRSKTCRFLADPRLRRKLRSAMRASLGRVLDNPIGLGDLAQRIAAMALLSAAPLACARAQTLQYPGLSSSTRRSTAASSCWNCPSPAGAEARRSPLQALRSCASARQRALRLRRKIHPTLESEIRPPVAKNRNALINPDPNVAFRTHPTLAVTSDRKRNLTL